MGKRKTVREEREKLRQREGETSPSGFYTDSLFQFLSSPFALFPNVHRVAGETTTGSAN